MANIPLDLTGKIFGRLTVLERVGSKHNKSLWKCQCKCGNTTEVISICLTRGSQKNNRVGGTKSCGRCKDRERFPKEYSAWSDMLQRCYTMSHRSYSYYGGRGIVVCKEWRLDFLNFLADMGTAPTQEYSLDRIDNNGDYTKCNCRWSTWSEQMKNRRFHNQFDH